LHSGVENTSSALDNIFVSYFFTSPQHTVENTHTPLTEQQIQQNTRIIVYDGSMNETRCPITMEDFVEGEEIIQIAGCGHYFKREALIEWFRRNHQCPVCRHRVLRGGGFRYTTSAPDDVATNGIVEEPDSDENENENENEETTVRLERNTTSPTTTYRMFEDRYTFELPLLYDTSNNVFYSENDEPIQNNQDLQQTIQRELFNAFQQFRSPRNRT
jgi:hypothetical protein